MNPSAKISSVGSHDGKDQTAVKRGARAQFP